VPNSQCTGHAFPSKPDAKGLENGFAGIIYGLGGNPAAI
jgi:hypothetical protein